MEPETVKEPPLCLSEYAEALGRVGCSTARRRKAEYHKHAVKSTNTLIIDFALSDLRIHGRDQLPECNRGGFPSPGTGREVVLRATYRRKGKTLKSPPIATFPNSRGEPTFEARALGCAPGFAVP